MTHLSLETILAIHNYLIVSYGGKSGVRDIGRLESAVASQVQDVFGVPLYPTIHEKAAALIRCIIQDHPFIDGNKRTGILAGLTFLELNGIRLDFKPKEIEDFAVQVAIEQLDIQTITAWLSVHINTD